MGRPNIDHSSSCTQQMDKSSATRLKPPYLRLAFNIFITFAVLVCFMILSEFVEDGELCIWAFMTVVILAGSVIVLSSMSAVLFQISSYEGEIIRLLTCVTCPLLWCALLAATIRYVDLFHSTAEGAVSGDDSATSNNTANTNPWPHDHIQRRTVVFLTYFLPVIIRCFYTTGALTIYAHVIMTGYSAFQLLDIVCMMIAGSSESEPKIQSIMVYCMLVTVVLILLNSAPVQLFSHFISTRRNGTSTDTSSATQEKGGDDQLTNNVSKENEACNGQDNVVSTPKVVAPCGSNCSTDNIFALICSISGFLLIDGPFLVMRLIQVNSLPVSGLIYLAKNATLVLLTPQFIYHIKRSNYSDYSTQEKGDYTLHNSPSAEADSPSRPQNIVRPKQYILTLPSIM